MNLDIDDFAVRGERGIDLFRRRQDEGSRRPRFICLATVIEPATGETDPLSATALPPPPEQAATHQGRLLICHEPAARAAAAGLWAAVARLQAQPALHRPFTLGEAPGYPGTEGLQAAHELFLYTEFFRERQLAAYAIDSLVAAMQGDQEAAAQRDPGELAAILRQALDYNMIARGAVLWSALQPLLQARAGATGLPPTLANATGYALRLLGDLRLRAGAAPEALHAFEAALQLGDNPFRRRRAIESALAAGQVEAAGRHIAAYAAHGPLPADLRALARAAGIDAQPGAERTDTDAARGGSVPP